MSEDSLALGVAALHHVNAFVQDSTSGARCFPADMSTSLVMAAVHLINTLTNSQLLKTALQGDLPDNRCHQAVERMVSQTANVPSVQAWTTLPLTILDNGKSKALEACPPIRPVIPAHSVA